VPNAAFATLQIIPSIRGIEGALNTSLGGVEKMGKTAGLQLGQGIASGVEQAKASVEKATAAVEKAMDRQADATGKARVAEAQLQALRDKGVTDAGRLAAAEEKAAKAKRDMATASKNAETAANQLSDAEKRAADAANNLGNEIDDTGRKSLISADNLKKFGAVAGTAFLAAGAALYKVGATFDDVADTIRTGTGKTGAELDALVATAKNVGTQVPAEFGAIGESVAELNSRLGLSGPELEEVTAQVMELGNMGQEVNLEAISGAMAAFGVESGQTSETLDQLFRVSQATGIPLSTLAASAEKGAPALKAFGFSAASSAGLIGSLDKAGLDADKMMGGLTKSLSKFSKDGKNAEQALFGSVVEIERFTAAGNDAAAIDAASKLFGTKGAAQFVDAVKAGTFSVDDFVHATGAGTDTIRGAGEDTRDFAEQWELFKNKTLVAIEPIAKRVFDALGKGMEWISNNGLPALEKMGKFVSDNKVTFGALAAILTTAVIPSLTLYGVAQAKAAGTAIVGGLQKIVSAWKVMGTALKSAATSQWLFNSAILANPITWIVVALVAVGVALWAFFTKTETGRKLWDKIWNGIKSAVSGVVNWFKDTAWPALKTAFEAIGNAAMWLWNNAIKPAWNGIKAAIGVAWNIIKGYFSVWQTVFKAVGAVVMWLWNNVIKPAWNGIKLAIGVAWNIIKGYFAAWKAAFNVVGDVVMWLWNTIIKPAWEGIKAAISVAVDIIGGVLGKIKEHFQLVADKAGEVKDWIVDKWDAVVGFFTGVKDKIASAASGMWDGIKDAFRGVINWVIRAWNSLSFTIPSVTVFGKTIGGATLSVPKLQELASGGTVGRDKNGRLWGPGTGTSDSILGIDAATGLPSALVSNGEGVVTERSMLSGGADVVAALNAGWVPSSDFLSALTGIGRHADGGVVGDAGASGGGYGLTSTGDPFPQWVVDLGAKYGVQPSTYDGHQTSDRGEAGYAPNPQGLNRGIDWGGSVDAMQAFADAAMAAAPTSPGLEQVIWMNPGTGARSGWAGRSDVSQGPYYDYPEGYPQHQNHVHTRQSDVWPGAGSPTAAAPDAVVVGSADSSPDAGTTTGSADTTSSTSATSSTGSSTSGAAESEKKSIGTSFSDIAGNFAKEFVGGQVSSLLGVLGIGDSPGWLTAIDSVQKNIKKPGESAGSGTDSGTGADTTGADTTGAATTTDGATTAPADVVTTTTPGDAPAGMVTNTPDGGIADGTPGAKNAVFAEWAKEPGWQSGTNWLDTLRLINGESGWRVDAANPTSSARGLFQFMDFTRERWPGYGDTAESQAGPGREYIKERYKTPSAAWEFWQNPSDTSVSNGHWYDAGGWLPEGLNLTMNRTGGPEPILTRPQWDQAAAAIDVVKGAADQARRQAPAYRDHIEYNISTEKVEDAFITAQLTERRRAATLLAGL
jgi:phage-related minor tail protein